MTDFKAFLRRHIEAFLDYEFGEATTQNTTPPGARRPVWTSEHTQRLVNHLASNWQMVEAAVKASPAEWHGSSGRPNPDGDHFQTGDAQAYREEYGDPGEVAADNAQADAAAAEWDDTPEGEKPPVNTEVPW